ncbi:MAG: hypothetical protein EA392_03305 [Cryomorphaceae bacterium]|nr:MAG: hypothetical protein EA392_03305 [Cryomorphaceae bacterium]
MHRKVIALLLVFASASLLWMFALLNQSSPDGHFAYSPLDQILVDSCRDAHIHPAALQEDMSGSMVALQKVVDLPVNREEGEWVNRVRITIERPTLPAAMFCEKNDLYKWRYHTPSFSIEALRLKALGGDVPVYRVELERIRGQWDDWENFLVEMGYDEVAPTAPVRKPLEVPGI